MAAGTVVGLPGALAQAAAGPAGHRAATSAVLRSPAGRAPAGPSRDRAAHGSRCPRRPPATATTTRDAATSRPSPRAPRRRSAAGQQQRAGRAAERRVGHPALRLPLEVLEAQQGFGLAHAIRQRLADVGEKAEISSTPGRGTKVTLWVPT